MNSKEKLELISKMQNVSTTLNIATEELAECVQAIQKYQRLINNDKTLRKDEKDIMENLKEELVDVYVVTTQLCSIIGFDETDFDSRVMYKANRTLNLLGGKENE